MLFGRVFSSLKKIEFFVLGSLKTRYNRMKKTHDFWLTSQLCILSHSCLCSRILGMTNVFLAIEVAHKRVLIPKSPRSYHYFTPLLILLLGSGLWLPSIFFPKALPLEPFARLGAAPKEWFDTVSNCATRLGWGNIFKLFGGFSAGVYQQILSAIEKHSFFFSFKSSRSSSSRS